MTYLQNQIENLIRIAQEEESYEPYYEVLEKITLSGAEYFDLGYKVSDFEIGDTIRFEGIVKGTEASTIGSSGSKLMYAIGNDGGQWLGKAQNGTKYAFGSSNQGTIDFNVEVLANITIALSGSASRPTFTISGSVTSDTATSTITQRSATPTYYDFHLLFGAGTKSTGEIAYGGDYTFKVGKIYINGTKTKDYIPVLDSQMRPCLYDRISKTFVYAKKISDGTDATSTLVFKRWNKYDVDYIESSGTQYIDTKYIPTNNSVYKFKAECTEDASGVRTVFGSRNTNDTASSVAYLYNSSSNARWATNTLKNNIATALEPHTCTLSKNGYEVDGINEQFAGQTFTGTSTNSVYLFAIHLADDTAGSISKIKCWNFDIEENGILVRSYKPTVWHNGDTTAVACLYDEVYNKMYTNAGTGSFKAYITNISTTKTNVFTTTGATSGKAINAEGTIINSSASSYSALLPIVGGTVIECVSGDTGNNNYRYHTYDSSGNWIEQSLLLYAEGTGRVEPVTGSFTAPANAKYVRVSYATTASDTIQVKSAVETTYEVGKSISNGQGAGYDLSVPYSNNFVFEAITTCKTTSSNYFMDTRKVISGSSATYQNDTGALVLVVLHQVQQ